MPTRFHIVADISGRVTEQTAGNEWATAAAIAIPLMHVNSVRSQMPVGLPKWRDCSAGDVQAVSSLLVSHSSAVGILQVNKDTEEWRQCWRDRSTLHSAITLEGGQRAGFISPATVLTYFLFGQAIALVLGQALRSGRAGGILNRDGRTLVEFGVTCDSDIKGDENIDVFKSMFAPMERNSRLLEIGVQPVPKDIQVSTEQDEPLLMLADYAAGICQMSHMSATEQAKLSCPADARTLLLTGLNLQGKLALHEISFGYSYDEVFGAAMLRARQCGSEG